jgi:hypothetical protein
MRFTPRGSIAVADTKLELVVEVEVYKANQSIKTVNSSRVPN